MQMRKIVAIGIVFLLIVAGLVLTRSVPRFSKEASSNEMHKYRKITPAEAKKIMTSGQPHVLLDVRTEQEFTERRIPGALLLPDYEIGRQAEAEIPDKGTLIIVYCRSGRRSASAAAELLSMGYTDVYDLGGIINWPYETTSD